MFFGYIDPGTGYTIFGPASWLIAFLIGMLGILSFFIKRIISFFKGHRRVIILGFVIILGLVLITIGVVMKKKESRFNKKVIILGFDGLSPKIIEPMMEEGKLLNFSMLRERGSYRHLSTTNPPQSPVAWAGFATGQNPGRNGVFDFIKRDPQNYGLSIATTNIKGSKAEPPIRSSPFWSYTSEQKIPTIIITCPVTFPPDKVYGRMISGMGVPDILGTQGTFSFYTTEPLQKDKDVGGKVFHIDKTQVMDMELIGPRKERLKGKVENVKVPFKAILERDSVVIEFQNNRFELKRGQWSNWKEVTFKLGLFKKIKGILKFYLVEISPEFKLYASPINFDPRNPFFQISYPKNYSKELAENIGLFYTQGMPCHTWAVNEGRLAEEPFLKEVEEVLREKKAILDFELGRLKKGVLFCYFESPDIIQHMFWRYTDEKHPLYEKDASERYKEMIRLWYQKMDTVLGDVLKRLDEQDMLIVLSDHGFGTFRRAVHINSWLRKNGYLKLKDPASVSGAELLQDVDWTQTKAYSIGFGAIYINQQGREGKGIVKPGQETVWLKQQIAAKLKKWRDEKYNHPVISQVYTREDIFWGGYATEAADLYIGFNVGYRASWQTAIGAVPSQLIEDNLKKWSGSHLFDPELIPGILFLNKKIKKGSPSIYDIAPTILKIVGFSDEEIKRCDFDGAQLF